MLGRLRMSVDEAIHEYGDLSSRIFGSKKWFFSEGKFKASLLEETLKDVIAKKVYNPEIRMLDDHTHSSIPRCKT